MDAKQLLDLVTRYNENREFITMTTMAFVTEVFMHQGDVTRST